MPPVTPYVPQRITVHLGAPDSNAQNVTVSFVDYVKNVASSEIYPTWEESALRANILAIVSFALNRVYGFPLSEDRAAAVAHSADVLCKTGLGTVVGERKGGFELRLKPGTPPYGEIDGFSPERPLYAVFVLFGPLSTVGSLSDPKIRADINRNGEAHLQRLREEPTPERFLEEASHFSEEVNLFSQNGLKAADLIRKLGYRPAMLMFGDGIYTFCNTRKEAQNLRKILKKNFKNEPVYVFDVEPAGTKVRLVRVNLEDEEN